jgi:phage terminase small subunit
VAMHNPHAAVANRAANTVARLAAELGLTPVSRTRVGAASRKPSAASPWDVFTVIDGGKTPA